MNSAEEGLLGFPSFTGIRQDPSWPARVWPRDMTEAADRPLYAILNLRKIDGGNDIFGPIGMVFRQQTMLEQAIIGPVDTGSYQYFCNASWPAIACRRAHRNACVATWSQLECSWNATTNGCYPNNRLHMANCSQWQRPIRPHFVGTLQVLTHPSKDHPLTHPLTHSLTH